MAGLMDGESDEMSKTSTNARIKNVMRGTTNTGSCVLAYYIVSLWERRSR